MQVTACPAVTRCPYVHRALIGALLAVLACAVLLWFSCRYLRGFGKLVSEQALMFSGRVMLVSSQCHCNSLNVNPKRRGGDTDSGSEMLNLANPNSEAAKTSQALPRFPLELLNVPVGTSGITVTGQAEWRNSESVSGDISLDRTGSAMTSAEAARLAISG